MTRDQIIEEDIARILQSPSVDAEYLRGKTILVTGATGMIGSMLLRALATLNERQELGMKLLASVRNAEKFYQHFAGLPITPLVHDICEGFPPMDAKVDLLFHGANSTSSRIFVAQPVETIESILAGTRHVLEFAKNQPLLALVYLSSLEVYGQMDFERVEPIREDEYGLIDPLDARSSYSQGKRMAECLCHAYASEYGVPVKIARLSQTLSPNVAADDQRVFASFARSMAMGQNIILHTEGRTTRNYCYITDALTALLTLAQKGESGQSYNIAQSSSARSIRDIAESLCERYPGSQLEWDIDGQERGFNPEMKVILDTAKLEALGWHAAVDLDEMFERLITCMSEECR